MESLAALRQSGVSIWEIAGELNLSPITVARLIRIRRRPPLRPCYIGCMKNKMVPIQFPPNFEEMFDNWRSCPDENVGWCLAAAQFVVRRT
jgi:hypothetical protein